MTQKWRLALLVPMILLLAACTNKFLKPPVPKTPTPLVEVTPTPHYYVVKPGDTLWSIANKLGLDVDMLAEVNELADPDKLRPGDRLFISTKMTISGRVLPTPTPTPIPCLQGCVEPPSQCKIKAYTARLDGMKLYVMPGDEIYPVQRAELWFCREQDALNNGWLHWTPQGPEGEK